MEKCGVGKTAIDKAVLKLKEVGYIERVGSNKTGYCKIIENNKKNYYI